MFIQFPEVHTPIQGMENVPIPNMVTIRQSYDPTKIEDIKGHMLAELEKVENKESYKGKRICITAGSRGIPDLDVMLRTICDTLAGEQSRLSFRPWEATAARVLRDSWRCWPVIISRRRAWAYRSCHPWRWCSTVN